MRVWSLTEVQAEIEAAERALTELGDRELRLWERVRVTPSQWIQNQYPNVGPVWVVALMGRRCLYLNQLEGGWGWGRFDVWGTVSEYHWQADLDIQHVIAQTLCGIDHGGLG